MDDIFCPNINTCRLVITDLVVPDAKTKQQYMNKWCKQPEDSWGKCKRYITKKQLSFCPDFVLPDTALSINEIVDKFDENN
jgi:hypothetical protein